MKKLVLITFFMFVLALHSFATADQNQTSLNVSNASLDLNISGNISQSEDGNFSGNESDNYSDVQENQEALGEDVSENQNLDQGDLEVMDREASYTKINTQTVIIALILGAVALAIIIIFVISFMRKPKQR